MKDYRINFVNSETGKRNRKDFSTLKGVVSFANKCGRDDCLITKYNPNTFEFEPIDYNEILKK